MPTKGGITQARKRLGPEPMARVFSQVAGPVADLDTIGAFLGPYKGRSGTAKRVRRARSRYSWSRKRPAGWSPFAGIARIRSLGSPFSLLLSGLSAFPSRLRLPGGWCGPAPSITSQTMVRLHGAEDGRLGPKAPACTGRTSWLRRTQHRPVISGASPQLRYRAGRELTGSWTVTARGRTTASMVIGGRPGSHDGSERRADRWAVPCGRQAALHDRNQA